MPEVLRKASTPLVAALLAATMFVGYSVGNSAFATHQPADKSTASASSIDDVSTPGPHVVLRDEMRVSSPSDLILQLTAECSLLTYLQTGEGAGGPNEVSDEASAFGSVRMWITVDGKRVPVSAQDTDPSTPAVETDDGTITFCNRAYQRRVTDSEDQDGHPNDGIDTEEDFIRTRTANGFNWFALDTGVNYDSPANGNNVLEIVVWAEYTRSKACANPANPIGEESCADAFVGRRSLIIEPVHAANDENTLPTGEGTPSPAPSGNGKGKP